MNQLDRKKALIQELEEKLLELQLKKKNTLEIVKEIEKDINDVLIKIPIEALNLQHNIVRTLKEKATPFKTVLCLKQHYEKNLTFSNIKGIGNYKNKLIKAAIHKYL